eukprot:TRINITY_DN4982_c0_g1_i1.p1 TRINITY_DN4982_c0_g1~~TRINITY_DN4982_c0_g1_i1.p1  ORF type:complete len:204 (+),score=31.76 TRINITY_DN4982_c0_g1_i1:764-1375(+)
MFQEIYEISSEIYNDVEVVTTSVTNWSTSPEQIDDDLEESLDFNDSSDETEPQKIMHFIEGWVLGHSNLKEELSEYIDESIEELEKLFYDFDDAIIRIAGHNESSKEAFSDLLGCFKDLKAIFDSYDEVSDALDSLLEFIPKLVSEFSNPAHAVWRMFEDGCEFLKDGSVDGQELLLMEQNWSRGQYERSGWYCGNLCIKFIA